MAPLRARVMYCLIFGCVETEQSVGYLFCVALILSVSDKLVSESLRIFTAICFQLGDDWNRSLKEMHCHTSVIIL